MVRDTGERSKMWATLSDAGENSREIRNENCPVDFARGKLLVYIRRTLLKSLLATRSHIAVG